MLGKIRLNIFRHKLASKKYLHMKALLLILALLLAALMAGLWVGSGGYPERWKTQDRISAQEDSNNERNDDIDKIQADLADVAAGDSAIEERARSELGMTKEDESFFEIILRPKSAQKPLEENLVKGRDLNNANAKKPAKGNAEKIPEDK
jgi:cell division protein FtsB